MALWGITTPQARVHGDAGAKPLNTPMMESFGKHYAPDENDPRFAVSQADLSGLPPPTIMTAEVDPLRDDGKLLAERLKRSESRVEHRHFISVSHEFFGMAPRSTRPRRPSITPLIGVLANFEECSNSLISSGSV
jgi:acetyl esterase/lipase